MIDELFACSSRVESGYHRCNSCNVKKSAKKCTLKIRATAELYTHFFSTDLGGRNVSIYDKRRGVGTSDGYSFAEKETLRCQRLLTL